MIALHSKQRGYALMVVIGVLAVIFLAFMSVVTTMEFGKRETHRLQIRQQASLATLEVLQEAADAAMATTSTLVLDWSSSDGELGAQLTVEPLTPENALWRTQLALKPLPGDLRVTMQWNEAIPRTDVYLYNPAARHGVVYLGKEN